MEGDCDQCRKRSGRLTLAKNLNAVKGKKEVMVLKEEVSLLCP
jgi:hypothetical protein